MSTMCCCIRAILLQEAILAAATWGVPQVFERDMFAAAAWGVPQVFEGDKFVNAANNAAQTFLLWPHLSVYKDCLPGWDRLLKRTNEDYIGPQPFR